MESNYAGGRATNLEAPLNLEEPLTKKDSVKWWNKPELYKGETRIWKTKAPAWRVVLSIMMIYGFYLGVEFTASLCTAGARFICAVALIASMIYIYWALWWDESVIIPPSMTFFNVNGYSTVLTLLMIGYETTLMATVALVIATAMMFTYEDLEDIFTWDC
jgi:hypothetical protein